MMYDKVILGENVIYSTDCEKTGINNNILVCGGSGSGKTRSIVEPCLLEAFNSSQIITVTKRRLVTEYSEIFRKKGYNVLDFNLVNPELGNCTFDPMDYIKDDSDVLFFADTIISTSLKDAISDDPYWAEAAKNLLAAEIAFVKSEMTNPKFSDVLEFHKKIASFPLGDKKAVLVKALFDKITKEKPDSLAASCWKSMSTLPPKTSGCVYGMLNTALATMFYPKLTDAIKKKKKIDINKIADKKTILFITTSPVNKALNNFVNIFYSYAFRSLFEYAEEWTDGQLPVPVRMVCDDFATGGKIADFAEYISIIREKGMSVTILLQSESQLASMYGASEATSIINNCDTYVYMGGMDLKTCIDISERIDRPVGDILSMPIGQEIIMRRGQKPIITKRYDIYAAIRDIQNSSNKKAV